MGASAWVFLDGKPHLDYRKGLNGLFTRKALQTYLPIQEKVWLLYFDKFVYFTKGNRRQADVILRPRSRD